MKNSFVIWGFLAASQPAAVQRLDFAAKTADFLPLQRVFEMLITEVADLYKIRVRGDRGSPRRQLASLGEAREMEK